MSPAVVGSLSLYELMSTAAALERITDKEVNRAPSVSEEEWESSLSTISYLAQFDSTLRLE